jgi:hypothetical protein
MRYTLLILSLLLASPVLNAQSKDSEKQLERVIEEFRVSISEHNDVEKFNRLFLHDSITWAAIFTNKTKEMTLKQRPDFVFHSGDYKTFYSNLKEGAEEKFYNVKIDRRGEFATISFDYSFSSNSKILNWGTEYWSLILVDEQWKITSVTWTMNYQEIERCPFTDETEFRLIH